MGIILIFSHQGFVSKALLPAAALLEQTAL